MNKSIFIVGFLLPVIAHAQSIKGRVVDEQSLPIAFANVVLLNLVDSAFIQGTITKNDGTFSIETDCRDGVLKVSSVGYTLVYTDVKQGCVGDIQMLSDTQILGEVTVNGSRPAYTMNAEGIQTNVEGTVLSKLGTGEDVLAHVPGIMKKQESIEVFGKGAPLVYINERLMRDISELDQLKSENIKSVELITNPGTKYDASVKAVVKIHTKAVQGEGFGFDIRSSCYQSENIDLIEQLNWNYRHNRFDVFGTFYYYLDNTHGNSTTSSLVQTDTLWQQNFAQDYRPKRQISRNTIGTNYQLDDNNSMGIRYQLTLRPDNHTNTLLKSDVTANGEYYDRLENVIYGKVNYRPDHQLSVYYKGRIGKVEIDFNTDYLYNRESDHAVYNEQSTSKDDRIINSENINRSELFASKLTTGYPLWGGKLTVGAEYTHTRRNDDYITPEQYVPTSYAKLIESNIAPFMEYSRQISYFYLTAGLRYEWVDFNYYENSVYLDEQSRSFGNFYPILSVGIRTNKVQMQLGYAAKTHHPSYQQLSNNVTYGNRFLLQSGNPLLNHECIHILSLMGVWKFLQFAISYNDRREAIINWSEQQPGNTSVTYLTHQNIPTLKSLSAQVAVAPKFGIWSPELSIGMQKQWFAFHIGVSTYQLNDPIFQFNLDNTFDFGHGWLLSAETNLTTRGHEENCYLACNMGSVNVSLTKSLLNDRLSIRIQGNDLFHTEKQGMLMYVGKMLTEQISWSDSREVVLTLRYKFNATQSKYKGTGAGNLEKERL